MAASARKGLFSGRGLVITLPYLWLLIFFALPFLIIFKISLSDTELAQPPYVPVFAFDWTWKSITDFVSALDFENYYRLIEDSLYVRSYLLSLKIATISTILLL